MSDKLKLLEKKAEQVLAKMQELRKDNDGLRQTKADLESQLAVLKRDYESLRLDHNDRSAQMKAKLSTVLNRIEELEKIGF